MKKAKDSFLFVLPLFLLMAGCESMDDGGAAPYYYGTGFYDPWYYGEIHDDDIIVAPPDGDRPRPSHPIASPPPSSMPRPTPMPSIPSMPRVAPRGR